MGGGDFVTGRGCLAQPQTHALQLNDTPVFQTFLSFMMFPWGTPAKLLASR